MAAEPCLVCGAPLQQIERCSICGCWLDVQPGTPFSKATTNFPLFKEAALAILSEAKDKPNNALLQYTLGLAYLNAEAWPQAIVALSDASELRPDIFEVRVALAVAYLHNGDWEIARRVDEALGDIPESAVLHDYLQHHKNP